MLVSRHRDKYLLVGLILGSFSLQSTSAFSDEPLDAGRAITLLEAASEAIHSYDVHIDVQILIRNRSETADGELIVRPLVQGEEPSVLRFLYRQVFSKGKTRVESFKFNSRGERIQSHKAASDGEVERLYVPSSAFAMLRPVGADFIPAGADYRSFFRSIRGNIDLADVFRQRLDSTKVTYSESDPNVVVMEAPPCLPARDKSFAEDGLRVTLDLEHGFLPRMVERYNLVDNEKVFFYRMSVDKYKRLEGGLWIPIEVTTSDLFPIKPYRGQVGSEHIAKVLLEKSSWNTEVSNQDFVLPIPAGTQVLDKLRGSLYTTGQHDPGSNLRALAKGVHSLGVLDRSVSLPQVPWWQTNRFLFWAIMLGVTLLVVLAVFFVLYRKRKGAAQA